MGPNMAAKFIYIPSSTKILTLTTAPFCFILVDALSVFEFPTVPGVYILLCPRKNKYTLFPDGTDILIQKHNHQKDLHHCLLLYYYGKVIAELEKTATKEFNCVYGACNLTK